MTTLDVNVTVMDFPCPGNEMVIPNEDGTYTILINAKLSYEGQQKAFDHAMKHIQEADFEKNNVQTIEARAHELNIPERYERIPSADFEKRLQELKRKHAATKRKLRDYERKIEFLRVYNPGAFYDSLERQYLYGDDL